MSTKSSADSNRSETPNFVASESDPTHSAKITPVGVRNRNEVPVRTIATTIAMVLATLLTLWILQKTSQVLTWILVSSFFTVVLNPLVDRLVGRLHVRRGLAVTIVSLLTLAAMVFLVFTFVRPIAKQGSQFATDFPKYVTDAKEGRGSIGRFIKERKIDEWVDKNTPKLSERVSSFFEPSKAFGSAVGALGSVFNGVAAVLTVIVMTILLLMQGQPLMSTCVKLFRPETQTRLRRLGRESAKATTGYVAGNLLISLIAGVSTFVFLSIVRVPYAGVLALWVAFADLIPLIGATLGAIPTVTVAFLHSTTAGIATLVFYILYQQFENHVLQVSIMSKTVALRPIIVLISVLIGVELFGLLGALMSIPFAAVLKVIGTDVLHHRRPDLFPSPSVAGSGGSRKTKKAKAAA
jgi:predicted PurR-regulated permease PerM